MKLLEGPILYRMDIIAPHVKEYSIDIFALFLLYYALCFHYYTRTSFLSLEKKEVIRKKILIIRMPKLPEHHHYADLFRHLG